MGSLDDEFAFLTFSVNRALELQEQTAQQLLDTMPRRGDVLARRLIAHYSELRILLDDRRRAFGELPDDALKQGAITEMRAYLEYARGDLQRCLSWLDAASQSVLDAGTLYFIQFLALRLVAPTCEVTVVTKADGSYSTSVNDFLRKGSIQPADPTGIAVVIFIPRREQESGLLHPLIVHEIGHAASRQHGLSREIVATARSPLREEHRAAANAVAATMETDDGYRKWVCATLEVDLIDAEDDEALTDAASQFLWTTARSCVEEVLCDAMAVKLLGPTYLYAFAAIVGGSDLDRHDHRHPPARLRIKYMLEQLSAIGWLELLEDQTPEIVAWFRDRAAEPGPRLESPDAFNVKVVEHRIEAIRARIDAHVGELAFSPGDFDEDVRKDIAALLAAGIPPAQRQEFDVRGSQLRRIRRSQIMFGSWLFAIDACGKSLEAIAKAPALGELSSLLPKALELSALQAVWEEGS